VGENTISKPRDLINARKTVCASDFDSGLIEVCPLGCEAREMVTSFTSGRNRIHWKDCGNCAGGRCRPEWTSRPAGMV